MSIVKVRSLINESSITKARRIDEKSIRKRTKKTYLSFWPLIHSFTKITIVITKHKIQCNSILKSSCKIHEPELLYCAFYESFKSIKSPKWYFT